MKQSIHVERDDVAAIVAATFPEYRGRKFEVLPCESVTFCSLNWSGGTRSTYRFASLAGQAADRNGDIMNRPAPWNNPYEGQSVTIPAGCTIVEHSIFCGKDSGLTIYARPEDIAPMLPAPIELSRDEKVVLAATKELKSSYAGRNRQQMANDTAPISVESWEIAKAALIARKFLNKAGAITNAGRNAVSCDLWSLR